MYFIIFSIFWGTQEIHVKRIECVNGVLPTYEGHPVSNANSSAISFILFDIF